MPGTVCPLGEVPTTVPAEDVLLTMLTLSATWKPLERRSSRALSCAIPLTLGTLELGAPST